jgi:nucleotide-binding universal stress UspA family protein
MLIAWNESAEAMRAIRAALPLLKKAGTVHIGIVDPSETGPERSDPGGALAVYLSRHGIKSDIQVMTRQGLTISERLAHHVTETGSDMLVMGGYGHSRFREAVLGGATRDMLENSKVPVLMAH